jgi:hypothetical protein
LSNSNSTAFINDWIRATLRSCDTRLLAQDVLESGGDRIWSQMGIFETNVAQ